MATVSRKQQTTKRTFASAAEWPAWTDEGGYEPSVAADWAPWTDAVVFEPTAADWAAHCERSGHRTAEPPAEPTLPAQEWLRGRAAFHRSASSGPDSVEAVVEMELDDLRIAFRSTKARSPRELLALVTPYRGIDLDAVATPEAGRTSQLAEQFDHAAQYYLDLGGDLARLAAAVLIRRADSIEFFRSTTIREYYEDEAAWEEAQRTVFEDGCASPENPLW